MKLYLVQHGDSLPKEVDPERPLSAGGRLARFLAGGNVGFARAFHSGKTRARQTAEILAHALAPGGELAALSGIDPNHSTDSLARAVGGWDQNTLVVGHLPFMNRFVARLVGGQEARNVVDFRPGGMVCLERTDAGGWVIAWMIRPELLVG
jgi:phosphohistidine phosphatase